MKIVVDPGRAKTLVANVQAVSEQIARVAGGRNVSLLLSPLKVLSQSALRIRF